MPILLHTGYSNPEGSFHYVFRHDTNFLAVYKVISKVPEPYLSPPPFFLKKGCDNLPEIKLKPKTKLCVVVKNMSNKPVRPRYIYLKQVLSPSDETFYGVPEYVIDRRNFYTDTLSAGAQMPLWFQSLPEEKMKIEFIGDQEVHFFKEVTTTRDSVYFYEIEIH